MSTFLPPLSPLDIDLHLNMTPSRAIKGECVTANYIIGEYMFTHTKITDSEIKLKLCKEIAAELYKQNLIEFTKEQRHDSGDTHYRARIFAVPNTDVQLLREQKVIK